MSCKLCDLEEASNINDRDLLLGEYEIIKSSNERNSVDDEFRDSQGTNLVNSEYFIINLNK